MTEPFDAEAMAREIVAQYRVEEWTQLGDDKNRLLVGKVAAALQSLHDAHEAEARRLMDALTPSAETKAAYMGEFTFGVPDFDEGANEVVRNVNVPWTTIKAIMAAIRAFAEPETTEQLPSPAVPASPRRKQP